MSCPLLSPPLPFRRLYSWDRRGKRAITQIKWNCNISLNVTWPTSQLIQGFVFPRCRLSLIHWLIDYQSLRFNLVLIGQSITDSDSSLDREVQGSHHIKWTLKFCIWNNRNISVFPLYLHKHTKYFIKLVKLKWKQYSTESEADSRKDLPVFYVALSTTNTNLNVTWVWVWSIVTKCLLRRGRLQLSAIESNFEVFVIVSGKYPPVSG